MTSKKALVTFTIGDKYKKEFELFRPSFERYCQRYSWDLIVLDQPLDDNEERKHIICQKLLINCQPWSKDYDVITWIDSDQWITDTCPEFPTPAPGKIGISLEGVMHNDLLYDIVKRKRSWGSLKEYYKKYGFDDGPEWAMNAGLMIFRTDFDTREMYNELLKFCKTVSDRADNGTLNHYDQPWLGWKFFNDDCYEIIDWRFNMVWPVYRAIFAEPYDAPHSLIIPMKTIIDMAYTLHFTDREDINVLSYIRDNVLPLGGKTLIVEEHEVSKAFSACIRICNFKKIIIRTDDISKLKLNIPISQYGWVIPDYVICSLTESGDITVDEVVKQLMVG